MLQHFLLFYGMGQLGQPSPILVVHFLLFLLTKGNTNVIDIDIEEAIESSIGEETNTTGDYQGFTVKRVSSTITPFF